MKLIGFIKEHDDIPEAVSAQDIFGKDIVDGNLLLKITRYLDDGKYVFGWMEYVMDLKTKEPLCDHSYYTDGIWVWPSYFSCYLKRYSNLIIDSTFIDYLSSKSFINNAKNNPQINLAELEEKLGNKFK